MTELLGLGSKWAAVLLAIRTGKELKTRDIPVLVEILQHHNPKTGRCDPSHERIAESIGCTRETVCASVKRLRNAGAFQSVERRPPHSNQYNFAALDLSTVATETDPNAKLLVANSEKNTTAAVEIASHKKKGKRRKENLRQRSASIGGTTRSKEIGTDLRSSEGVSKLQAKAEARLVRAIQKAGLSYEDLINLPGNLSSELVASLAASKITVDEAVQQVIAQKDNGSF